MAYRRRNYKYLNRAYGFKKVSRLFQKKYRPFIGGYKGRNDFRLKPGGKEERLYGPFVMTGEYGKVKCYMKMGDYIQEKISRAMYRASKAMISICIRAGRLGMKAPSMLCALGYSRTVDGGIAISNAQDLVEGIAPCDGVDQERLANIINFNLELAARRRAAVPLFNGEVFGNAEENPQTAALRGLVLSGRNGSQGINAFAPVTESPPPTIVTNPFNRSYSQSQ